MKSKKRNAITVYLLIFFIFAVWNYVMPWKIGDDTYFSSFSIGMIVPTLKIRYQTWSSRIIIDGFTMLISKVPHVLWAVIEAMIMLLLVRNLIVLSGNDKDDWKAASISLFLMLLIRTRVFISAGTVATGMNYIWTAAFATTGLLPLWYTLHNKKLNWWQMLLISMAVLYAANMEIAAALLAAYYFIYYLFYKKDTTNSVPKWYINLNFVFICLSLLLILTCPGNALRSAAETDTWLPAFAEYTVFKKINVGWLMFSSYYLTAADFNPVILIFSFILGLLLKSKNKNKWWIWMPTCMSLVSICAAYLKSDFFSFDKNAILALNAQSSGFSISAALLVETLYSLIFFCILFLMLWKLGEDRKQSITLSLIYLSAITSKVIMGFSPTVYASGNRTTLFCTFIIYGLILWMTGKLRKSL